jgi:hypothetical protein
MDTIFKKNGKPFFPLGGQSMNSTPWQKEDRDVFWRALELMRGNTAELPISWGDVEKREGQYDFSLADILLQEARERKASLIFLWFGAWKNGLMRYAPDWVKEDAGRFRRVTTHDGYPLAVLSSHCAETLKADTRAFVEFMKYIKKEDEEEGTVVGIQIQNEPGIWGRAIRDHHPDAETEWGADVPEEALAYIAKHPDGLAHRLYEENGRKKGGWRAVFGPQGDEFLTAWSIGRYINAMAAAGKAVYPLPMIVNVSLDAKDFRLPGISYSAGGPVPRQLDIWKAATPDVDVIGPDIYQGNPNIFREYCRAYDRSDNALFVPESDCRRFLNNAMNMFAAIGDYGATGYFSFGIEHVVLESGEVDPKFADLVGSFRCAAAVLPLLVKYRKSGRVHAVMEEELLPSQYLELGEYAGSVDFEYGRTDFRHRVPSIPQDERGRGLIIQTGPREFYLCGGHFRLTLRKRHTEVDLSELRDEHTMNFILVDEGYFTEDGEFQIVRRRTGDESDEGIWVYADVGAVHAILCD